MSLRLLASGLLGLVLSAPLSAAVLTAAEVEQKLRLIPVHVLTDAEGAPLVANGAFGVFLDRADADAFLADLHVGKPDLAKQVVIRAIPLSEVVSMTGPGSALQPDFVGAKKEREAAEALRGKDAPPIGNAPLFVVRAGTAYLTVTAGERSIIPVFFTKAQADEVVARYGKTEGPEPPRIEVAALEVILNALLGADDPDVSRISLVPSEAMMAAVQPAPGAP